MNAYSTLKLVNAYSTLKLVNAYSTLKLVNAYSTLKLVIIQLNAYSTLKLVITHKILHTRSNKLGFVGLLDFSIIWIIQNYLGY